MQNPWINLPITDPYLLDMDKQWEQEHFEVLLKRANKLIPELKEQFLSTYKLHLEVMPIPYYGNPSKATVIVLQANPGHDAKEDLNPHKAKYPELLRKNLLHTSQIPLFTMDPNLRSWTYTDGSKANCWYYERTRELREAVGWEKVAEKLIYLELFPYRSKRLFYPKRLPPSQDYVFQLLREMMNRGVWIISTRMKKQWEKNVPELINYEKLIVLHSKQNVTISRNNVGDKFDKIIEILE